MYVFCFCKAKINNLDINQSTDDNNQLLSGCFWRQHVCYRVAISGSSMFVIEWLFMAAACLLLSGFTWLQHVCFMEWLFLAVARLVLIVFEWLFLIVPCLLLIGYFWLKAY